jgi:hypothetical protein
LQINRKTYQLLLFDNPCKLFEYFNVNELHGLNYIDCLKYNNTNEDSYIAGLTNYIPKASNEYNYWDERFLFINTLRCTNDINTMGLVMHEMMHHSLWLFENDLTKEEQIISYSENESYKIIKQIKNLNYANR